MSAQIQEFTAPVITRMPPIDRQRGIWAMYCVIATEATLFLCLFSAYFYLEQTNNFWSSNKPPRLSSALIMLTVLLISSGTLEWGSREVKRERFSIARLALVVTIALGFLFLVLQFFEYASQWKTLTPTSNSYGSIFYAITSFHAAHVIGGLLVLCYVAVLPRIGPARETPYRPYETAALYWHFVDLLWLLVVLLLYVGPNIRHG